MKENECNVFEEKAKQNSEMELKRIWETISDTLLWKEGKYDEAVLLEMDLMGDEGKNNIVRKPWNPICEENKYPHLFEYKITNYIQGEKIMKYTKEEIKAMYEYDKMIEGIFLDFDEYRKILKKALKKSKIFFISKKSC